MNKLVDLVLSGAVASAAVLTFAGEPRLFGNIEETDSIYDADTIDEMLNGLDFDVTARTIGGWKDPYFWLPEIKAGSGTSRQTVVERTGSGLGITGDTSYKRAYNDSNEAYVLAANIESERLADSSDMPAVAGTWTLVSDTSGSCTLTGNVLKGGGEAAVCVVRFTDTNGKSKSCTVSVGPWSRQELVVQNPWSEYSGTFRKAYSDAILQKFAGLDYTTGHVFPNFLRFNRDRNLPCYFGKEPWEAELFSDYDTYATTRTATWNSSTNFSMFTGGAHDQASPTYKQTKISYAQGPKTMNSEFFWPALQAKLCSVSGERADWYAHKTAIRISKHYLLAANHYNQSTHRFFNPSTGAKIDVGVDGSKPFNQIYQEQTGATAGTDWLIQYIPDGALPDAVPCMEFIGTYSPSLLVLEAVYDGHTVKITFDRDLASLCSSAAGTYSFTITYDGVDYAATGNKIGTASGSSYTDIVSWNTSCTLFNGAGMEFGTYGIDAIFSLNGGGAITPPTLTWSDVASDGGPCALFNLSPSLLNGAPAIEVSQGNTVNLAYLSTSAPGDRVDGIYAPTNAVYYSHRLTLPNDWNWINTSYPAMNARHPYYNVRQIELKDGTDLTKKVTIDDIASISDHNPATEDDFMLYKGEHYVIAGDSARPLMGYFNDHLWLYGIYFFASGGDSALNTVYTKALDRWIREDSVSRYGAEEGLTFIDCCTLDPNHTYHSH